MAGTSLLLLIDDIASILDDVALMAKVAAKKVAGVIGDDLALNAEQVTGMRADRELPVVWAVAKGSLVNKLILIPLALAINAFAPQMVIPLLMLGGIYLCFEGTEKIVHKFSPADDEERQQQLKQALADPDQDIIEFEREKISGAIRTDFVLSAEIIVIALGSVVTATFLEQLLVLTGLGILMTIGVYGLVAIIVKLDDLGLYLSCWQNQIMRFCGKILLNAAPQLLKALTLIGMVAMFLVGGGIITHGISSVHHFVEKLTHFTDQIPLLGAPLAFFIPLLIDGMAGIIAGAIAVIAVKFGERFYPK